MSNVDPLMLTGLRLAIAAIALGPLAIRDWRRHRAELNWSHLRDCVFPALAMSAHFVSWIFAARLTLASNGSLIVNLTPIVTPFLLALISSERVTNREILATLTAAVGLAMLFVADYRHSSDTFLGDVLCFVSMLLFAVYLVLGRKFRHHPTTLLYVTPLYAIASIVTFALSPVLGSLFGPSQMKGFWQEAPWVLLLALLPTIIGHSLLNQAMRCLRGQVVAVVNMSQFVFAGLLGWLVLGEQPGVTFYPAAFLVVLAGLIAAEAPLPWKWSLRGSQAGTSSVE